MAEIEKILLFKLDAIQRRRCMYYSDMVIDSRFNFIVYRIMNSDGTGFATFT